MRRQIFTFCALYAVSSPTPKFFTGLRGREKVERSGAWRNFRGAKTKHSWKLVAQVTLKFAPKASIPLRICIETTKRLNFRLWVPSIPSLFYLLGTTRSKNESTGQTSSMSLKESRVNLREESPGMRTHTFSLRSMNSRCSPWEPRGARRRSSRTRDRAEGPQRCYSRSTSKQLALIFTC